MPPRSRLVVARRLAVASSLLVSMASSIASAAPFVPTRDDIVVESLPARIVGAPTLVTARGAGEPKVADATEAVTRARSLLDQARDRGDPRYAGYALAALAPWRDASDAPEDVTVLQATLAQYQHDFDGARAMLERVIAKRPDHAQALLTLATIARVQGRYGESDAACRRVAVRLYAAACLAENVALRGRFDEARETLNVLIASSMRGSGSADVRRWLLTTRAELEQRAGRPDAARQDFDAAGALGRDSYLVLDEADLLLEQGRAADAASLLEKEPQPYGDGVLLRLAIASARLARPGAKDLAAQLAERFAASRERGDAISIHGREYARYLDAIARQPREAVAVARDNLRVQKEPADFLVMADAARAANDAGALRETADLARSIGLVDRRLERLVDAR